MFRLWPQSLFGRLIAASVLAVLIAQAAALVLIAQERERFVLQISVREWTREIADTMRLLAPMSEPERTTALAGLSTPRGLPRPLPGRERPALPPRAFVRVPLLSDFEETLQRELQAALGAGYAVTVAPTPDPERPAVPVAVPYYEAREVAAHPDAALRYDVAVRFPDGDAALFRVTRMPHGATMPRNLYLNLTVLVLILVIALYVTARNVTRPLSALARAADRIGRGDTRPSVLEERGARELRNAARAFNTMQDRLRRYLDSRTRVLAAMSHDLKTPLTRLRLQVETLDNPPMQARIGRELDEMESMVREALALFRGPDDTEPESAIDLNALLADLAGQFAEMGGEVTVEGRALEPYGGKARLLKRCLTNLIANAITFGTRARVLVEDGVRLTIRVRDEGPGIPEAELERVFEPFYRLESSRNRASGGTGLGLSIARDIAEAHGGSLALANRPEGGLEATLVLPRRR
ncbi:MAG TPA: ATP-binding protein [Steroidobacteraceae bacterium]|nr:ATP-binding protein [Steroidobacteraceae bacterium]